MSSKKRRNEPIKFDDDLGIRLYGPTASNPEYRLDYHDPLTGRRYQPRRTDRADAFSLWAETVKFLTAARWPPGSPRRRRPVSWSSPDVPR